MCVQKQKRNERKSAERVDINLLRNRPITFNNYTSIRLISFCRDYIKDSPRLQKKKRQMRFSLSHTFLPSNTHSNLWFTLFHLVLRPSTLPNALIDPFTPNPNLYQSSVWSTFKVPFIDIDIFTHSSLKLQIPTRVWSILIRFTSFTLDFYY